MGDQTRRGQGGLDRRDFLKLGGGGALVAATAGTALVHGLSPVLAQPGPVPAQPSLPQQSMRLVATDGYISLPGRRFADGNPLYSFGFREPNPDDQDADPGPLVVKYKGKVQHPSPIIGVDKNSELYLTLTNLGLLLRPDLDDAHTVHWHGFRNPVAVFDGVPEVSVSVPPARDFPYYYEARVEGTYMYHCHFEDSEHVQMGMTGVAYIRALNGNTYDGDGGATAFDREFTFILNEVDTRPHDNLEAVQEFVWSDYDPNYWVINGRSYPDTVIRDQDLRNSDFDNLGRYRGDFLGYTQPISSLVQVEEGETALLRFASLGYQQHTMQLLGIPMTIVGHDASYLGDQTYQTDSIFIGPGEARDALITAPSYSAGAPGDTDDAGDYNRYWLRNRNGDRLRNADLAGLGGMVTEVRVYPAGTLGAQTGPNETV